MTTYRLKLILQRALLAQKLLTHIEQRVTEGNDVQFAFTENNTVLLFSCSPLERAYLLKACGVHLGSEECNAIDQKVGVEDMEVLADKYNYI